MPSAERLYYDDSFLRTFTARVTDIREYARTEGQSQWQIALDRTAFYPTSGGQPFDRGTLTAQSRSGAELVAEIDEVMEDEDGEVWHATRKPLPAGAEVSAAINWPRRLDHMQQHSGQHLLSAVCAAELGARTLSFHLGEAASTIDLAAETAEEQQAILTALSRVEQIVHSHIAEGAELAVRTVSAEEAESLLASGRLRKLPAREGPIRLVEIPGLDLNACGGTHVRSLGQIGGLLVRGTERTRKAVRVEFVCGARAVAAAREDFALLSEAAGMLSTARTGVPAAVERLLLENRHARRLQQRLLQELAQHHAVQLAIEEHIDRGLRLVYRTFVDQEPEYIRMLAARLVATVPQTAVLLVTTMREPASLVLACSPSLHCGCGERLKQALAELGLKGGGSADMAQATVPRAQVQTVAVQLRDQLGSELRRAYQESEALQEPAREPAR